jgi:hypothetical protein
MVKLNALPEVQKIAEERKAAQPAFQAYLKKAFA